MNQFKKKGKEDIGKGHKMVIYKIKKYKWQI